jgi:hypothetical protein
LVIDFARGSAYRVCVIAGADRSGCLCLLFKADLREFSKCDSLALRPVSANLFRIVFVKLPQNRHPERSASEIDRVTQHLWRAAEGPRRAYRFDPTYAEANVGHPSYSF